MKTMVVGDVHGEFGKLNKLINKRRPEVILQCGDFGFWPRWRLFSNIKNRLVPCLDHHNCVIYFCDGNHEDHWNLQGIKESPADTFVMAEGGRVFNLPNIYYMKRGSILELDGKNILFVGGARSYDRNLRVEGIDWFPEEMLTDEDVKDIPDVKIDVVISHTCPFYFEPKETKNDPENYMGVDDCRYVLDKIYDRFKPKLWYFSHWHLYKKDTYKDCEWTCLNMANDTGWWEWL